MKLAHTLLALILLAPFSSAAETESKIALEVYKSPSCGCCGNWVEYMRKEGFDVTVHEQEDISPIKQQLGVPGELESCHTAKIGDYVIEGHVPAADVHRLLKEKPQARGLAAPGMPQSSPGMDVPGSAEAYDVILFKTDGTQEVYATHKPNN